ncbi:hypothetical protein PHISCL_04335 [Aspergillus sclerotialis]|uniref:Ankyrin repeat protein n=1 Tax=Aspergillus sclerotialis TaxID=2070753 RepID=A0A3A2ZJF8_9EURO|nr:hypothetical protein PHISCL_04335 [Aspergillus sclerotialis]
MLSTGFGREHILKMFLERPSTAVIAGTDRQKVFRYAAEHGSVESVNMLLEMRREIKDTREDLF